MGATSMFLWALGLYPDKVNNNNNANCIVEEFLLQDTFYTTTTEVVTNPKSQYYNFKEPYPYTQAICAALG